MASKYKIVKLVHSSGDVRYNIVVRSTGAFVDVAPSREYANAIIRRIRDGSRKQKGLL